MKNRNWFAIAAGAVFCIVCAVLLSRVAWQGSASHYAVAQSFSAGFAFFAGVLALIRFYTQKHRTYLLVGLAMLLASIVDAINALFHTLWLDQVVVGLPDVSFFFLNASPFIFVLLVTMNWLWAWREDRQPVMKLRDAGITAVFGTLIVVGILLVRRPDAFNIFVRIQNLVTTTLVLFCLASQFQNNSWVKSRFQVWLLIALWCHTVAHLLFLPFVAQPFDLMHITANLFKPVAFLAMLLGLLQSMIAFFRRAEETAHELRIANLALQREIADRKRVETSEQEQRRLAEALREIGLALSATLDFDDLLDCLLDQIAEVLPYDTANVMQVNGDLIEIVCTRGYNQRIVQPFVEPFPISRMPSLQQMVFEQKPLVIDDTAVYPKWVHPEESPHVRSWAGAPIYVQGQIVAFLALNNSKPGFYQTSDSARLEAFAGQAAIAIQNARLYEALQKRVDELLTLNKISQAVTSTLELQKTLTIITDETTRLLSVDATSVVLLDEERGDLHFAAASGEASDFVLGKRMALGQGILGWVSQNGKPLMISDAKEDRRHFPTFDDQSGFTARSILCVPLQSKGQTIGAIEAINKWTGPFNEDDLRLLTLLSGPLATAIENAQLYEKAQQEIANRAEVEAALEAERELLARRVEERTADLSAANAELARAARLKDEFLASISHELRTPLNAVLGISEALQEEVYGPLNQNQLSSLGSIEESGRHLLSLINDILDLSKVEAGKLELEIRPISVESVCHASLRLIKQNAHKKRLKVHSTIDSSINTIQADERRVKQILVNLLSNAVKFTLEEGEIGLEVHGDHAEKIVRFTVWDNGIGIAKEDISRLFRPFVQLDSRLSREYMGTGLGLSLVYKMVELHGGTVAVDSALGKGTRFTISLPWQESSHFLDPVDEADLIAADAPHLTGYRRAMLVEDSPAATAQIIRYLGELGMETITCSHGQGAWEKALVEQPDVIILDILLPDVPGWNVLRQLKSEPPTRDIPVLIVSVVDEPAKAIELGASATLVKPINRQQFQSALRQILVERIEAKRAMIRAASQSNKKRFIDQPLILLAEDNESTVKTFSDYLLSKHYRLLVAGNGIEVVKMAKETQPDLILMDIQMPGMNGFSAIREIRAVPALAKTPIIAVTALAMSGDQEACFQAGATGYLSKPVKLKKLVDLIEAQLGQQMSLNQQ